MAVITHEQDGKTLKWVDKKRYLWVLGLVVPLLPFLSISSVNRTGLNIFYWSGPLWIFIGIPLLDWIFGEDKSNPPEWAVEELSSDKFYRYLTYLYIPMQYGSLIFGAWMITTRDMSWLSYIGYSLTVGTVAGVGINTAHELGHKQPKVERWAARIALAQSAYGHFYVEHNRGHHIHVSTPLDPATSRFGESFYRFFPRTVIGSLKSSWGIEKGRLVRQGLPVWSHHNQILTAWAMTVVLFVGITIGFGVKVIPYLIIQAVFGFFLLEVVNYLEHYGLKRKQLDNGRYEKCRPEHSWNSNHIASNLVLFQLERHSDHHANPARRYQALRHFEEAPQLPSGYGLMIGIALIPPLWRKVVDPRVLNQYNGDLSLINIDPKKRDKVYAKYGTAS